MILFKKYVLVSGVASVVLSVGLHGAARFPILEQGEIAKMMTAGGDDRIIVPAGKSTNRYHTGPSPRYQTVMRSSATSCSPSAGGFLAAQQLYDLLRISQERGNAERCFANAMQNIRSRMKLYWGSNASQPCYVITTPSGTDAEMLPALAALFRHEAWGSEIATEYPLVTNIIVANGEVGTGTVNGAGMRHFSPMAPAGKSVVADECIDGVPRGAIEVIGLKFRDEHSSLVEKESLENNIQQILFRAIREKGQIAILHMVHVSKTGLNGPSAEFVAAMKAEYGDKLIVVVDAAHFRVDSQAVGSWLDAGYWILVTGSKFLGGASFSGALFVPQYEAELFGQAAQSKIPAGLGDYISPDDCDEHFSNLRGALPTWYNVGLALRWETALADAGKFCSIEPSRRDRGIAAWANGARMIVKASENLHLLEELVGALPEEAFDGQIGKKNTVVSFAVSYEDESGSRKYMNAAQLRKVHELVTLDLTERLAGLTDEGHVVETSCLIGQPVQVGTAGNMQAVLRIAIAVPELVKAFGSSERVDPLALIDDILSDDSLVVKKIDLIAKHWHVLNAAR